MIPDDTEQAVLLAQVLLRDTARFDAALWAERLLDWEEGVKARGGYDLLGPSTKRAIDAIRAGTRPEEAGRDGTTNGAAMRAAPVGILVPSNPLAALVSRVAETCRPTHNTSVAIGAAAAVAATVSAGVSGATWRDAADGAVEAARALVAARRTAASAEVDTT
jgi:ADP-ribosylglycohydrolase